ncbi:MAG: glycogen synthase GlgA [Fusobacterium sp.]|uniref:glycogen synthase GlgA n=1 Tax=Fusobacterium sp. TaxID=68766 RepID=UPI0026DD161C|nr:glycogen synthase GlgA [Fusobacterium sp.]MDO4690290.1 glycogen synthase GlgA [Fusobacterium sp.]
MKILFIAAECSPFIKTGGLGDVIGSLPKALNREKTDTRVVLPLYSNIDRKKYKIKFLKNIFITLGWRNLYCGIFEAKLNGVKYYFIDNEQYFNRSKIYGEYDDAERFAFFSKAAIEIIPYINFKPDLINANDWHTALSIVYLSILKNKRYEFYSAMKSVLSIHNIEFQGRFSKELLVSLFGIEKKYHNSLLYDNDVNLLKGGIQLADRVNTVSETYAVELLDTYFSFGMDRILKIEKWKLRGIVNGIDHQQFNPEKDKNIYHNYSKRNYKEKIENKLKLQEELGLEINQEIPIISMVTRLTDQKGINLVLEVAEQILNMGTQLIILGTGDSYYENRLKEFEFWRHDRARALIMFSNEISSKIYAASDIYLMPSKSEPCGLSQLIAMRYGTIPIVNRVGGLRDTVEPFNTEEKTGNGFTFESFNAYDMLYAIRRALNVYYYDKASWNKIIKNAMSYNSKWKNSAQQYLKMYKEVVTDK